MFFFNEPATSEIYTLALHDAPPIRGYPMGPLTLLATVGLDVALAAAESLYAEFAQPNYAPPALLRRKVDAGHLGRKTGQGFYSYK